MWKRKRIYIHVELHVLQANEKLRSAAAEITNWSRMERRGVHNSLTNGSRHLGKLGLMAGTPCKQLLTCSLTQEPREGFATRRTHTIGDAAPSASTRRWMHKCMQISHYMEMEKKKERVTIKNYHNNFDARWCGWTDGWWMQCGFPCTFYSLLFPDDSRDQTLVLGEASTTLVYCEKLRRLTMTKLAREVTLDFDRVPLDQRQEVKEGSVDIAGDSLVAITQTFMLQYVGHQN